MTNLEMPQEVLEASETEMMEEKIKPSAFEKLGLSDFIIKAVLDMGFENPSSIQAEAIPQILEGTDIIAQAPTGSGKTAAFAIPVLEKINPNDKKVQALVLCPTRELAIQVHKEFEKLTKFEKNINVVSVYGGQQIDRQLNALGRKPQIIVATPGRLMDHLRRGSINLELAQMVVLDEADEMLDMGFRDDIYSILDKASDSRQTILFSATMEKDIMALAKKFQKHPNIVDVMDSLQSAPDIEQLYFEVIEGEKFELLSRLLTLHNVTLGLVFCNTKTNVDKVVEALKFRGFSADALHGDMNQAQREKVMRGFRNGAVHILVATDVAGRGIDVKNVQAVFNYDMPRDDEDYIHRIGRTARAGESGQAFTFVSKRQVSSIKRIERKNGVQINKKEAPTFDELEQARNVAFQVKIERIVKNSDLSEFKDKINAMVSEDVSLLEIASAMLKISMDKEVKSINKNMVFTELTADDSDRKRTRRGTRAGRSRRKKGTSHGVKVFDAPERPEGSSKSKNLNERFNKKSSKRRSKAKNSRVDEMVEAVKHFDRKDKKRRKKMGI